MVITFTMQKNHNNMNATKNGNKAHKKTKKVVMIKKKIERRRVKENKVKEEDLKKKKKERIELNRENIVDREERTEPYLLSLSCSRSRSVDYSLL